MTKTRGLRGRRATARESALRDAVVEFLRNQDVIRKEDINEVANISVCGCEIEYRQSSFIEINIRTCFVGPLTAHQTLVIQGPPDNSASEPVTLMDAEWSSDDGLRVHRLVKDSRINTLLAAIASSYSVSRRPQ